VSPERIRATPRPIIANTDTTKPYVGIANAVPDSFTPRRFARVSIVTMPRDSPTACGASTGNADTMFATPAATDTATVST
jgi:hypothetical protein